MPDSAWRGYVDQRKLHGREDSRVLKEGEELARWNLGVGVRARGKDTGVGVNGANANRSQRVTILLAGVRGWYVAPG